MIVQIAALGHGGEKGMQRERALLTRGFEGFGGVCLARIGLRRQSLRRNVGRICHSRDDENAAQKGMSLHGRIA